MPCTDVHVKYDGTVKTEITDQPANPHEDETCSPFCNCFCCGSIAVQVSVLSEIVSVAFKADRIFQTKIFQTKNFPLAVWQPPKLA